jgi:hypothetical protein
MVHTLFVGDKVKAAKEKLARALADDEAGWAEYVQDSCNLRLA